MSLLEVLGAVGTFKTLYDSITDHFKVEYEEFKKLLCKDILIICEAEIEHFGKLHEHKNIIPHDAGVVICREIVKALDNGTQMNIENISKALDIQNRDILIRLLSLVGVKLHSSLQYCQRDYMAWSKHVLGEVKRDITEILNILKSNNFIDLKKNEIQSETTRSEIFMSARFKAKLESKGSFLYKTILNVDNTLSEYLQHEKYEYFPSYFEHIYQILNFVDKLIPDNVFNLLRPEDIHVLILSIYLHDMGMLIRPQGVSLLLKNKKWNSLWLKYCAWLRRADDKKLQTLYGKIPKIIELDIDNLMNSYNKNDITTIGEFLAWNHHKFAKEIAINGLFANGEFHKIFHDIDEDLLIMASVLAKSHGSDLRDLRKELILDNGLRPKTDKNIPFLYLACVLRLADLLDVRNQRAPKIINEIQNTHNPYSIREHEINLKFDYEKLSWGIAKECLDIPLKVYNAPMYVRVKNWLIYTQHQLDLSWARLSEHHYSGYGLSIHRLSSNILDEDYNLESGFLPKDVAFTANPDILKLLIAPLYGDNPSYGVRELLQNSVDACLERAHKSDSQYMPKITIRLYRNKNTFIIQDNGIGMTSNTITEYFLKAGASLRNSDVWKRDFSTDSKTSKVLRTGRFGVGVLAAFLIGSKIKVITYNASEKRGYTFDVGLEDELINVIYTNSKRIGTTIIIRDADISRFFFNYRMNDSSGVHEWDTWFYHNNPEVIYYVDNKEENTLDKKDMIPLKGSNNWLHVKMHDGLSCMWQADYSSSGIHGVNVGAETKYELYCNGFYIGRKLNIDAPKYLLPKAALSISFEDPNAVLPIDLRRLNIDYEYRNDNCGLSILEESIYRYSFAMMLLGEIECVVHHDKGFIPKMRSMIDTIDEIDIIGITTLDRNVYFDIQKLADVSKVLNAAVFLQTREFEDDWITEIKKNSDKNDKVKEIVGTEVELTIYNVNKFNYNNITAFFQLNPLISKITKEIFPSGIDFWFPFDLEKRQEKFELAYENLNTYLSYAIEAVKEFSNFEGKPPNLIRDYIEAKMISKDTDD